MAETISLRDANQNFARCVREVEGGKEFVITRNGKPVAKLVPVPGKRVLTAEQKAALERMVALMEQGILGDGPVEPMTPEFRASLHER